MSLSSYSDIKQAVANWLNRDDLGSFVPDFISLGEDRIYRDLRIRAMETTTSDTTATGSIAVPSGYLEMKHVYVDGTPIMPLKRMTAEQLYQNYPLRSSTDKPQFFARDGDSFIFGPYPDAAYTVYMTYFIRLSALSDTNNTNWFTTNAPSILLWASLLEAEPFIQNDDRIPIWKAKYEEIRDNVKVENDRELYSGSPLRAVVSWS